MYNKVFNSETFKLEEPLKNVIDNMRDVILEYEQGFIKNDDYAIELLERVGSSCYGLIEDVNDIEFMEAFNNGYA